MNKEIKICYSIRNNIGDAINPYIIEKIIGYKSKYADLYHCEVSGIGSGLGRFFYSPSNYNFIRKARKELLKVLHPTPVVLWSSGFISTPKGDEKPTRSHIEVASLRGKLSLQTVERSLKKDLKDCVVGDAGILASELVPKTDKKYLLGIIPHDNERKELKYLELADSTPKSIIIDVRTNVYDCLTQISQCEHIISSSLHGLVIADGFGIPNRHVVLTNKLAGDGFKFRDYYSSYDLSDFPLDVNNIEKIDINQIIDNYYVSFSDVCNKKNELINSFKKFL